MTDTRLWSIALTVDAPDRQMAEDVIDLLEPLASSSFEDGSPDRWRVVALFDQEPQIAEPLLSLGDVTVDRVEDQNWQAKVEKGLPAIRAGRFEIRGTHITDPPAPGLTPLTVGAGLAFGTGHHGSTAGAITALCDLSKSTSPQHVIDVGCGTGVLALVAHKLWRRPILASDIDPVSVVITKENAVLNEMGPAIRAVTAPGMQHPVIAGAAPYDLIIANILARPLSRLAPVFASHLMIGGHIILSGIMAHQARWVANAYLEQGLHVIRRHQINEWTTLTLSDQS